MGEIEEVRRLLSPTKMNALAADFNFKDAEKWTALHHAANEGNFEMIKELVLENKNTAGKIDMQPLTKELKRSPLHLAA